MAIRIKVLIKNVYNVAEKSVLGVLPRRDLPELNRSIRRTYATLI